MKKTLPWHHTRLGGIVHFLGSIQLAVPVLFLVAIAMGVGTYLESAHNVRVARQYVYGSLWFLGVMGLVCVSLIFAVITRFPWKRRHIGFITVHASLVALIGAGFWSMFARVEGHLTLEEGTSGDTIETADEQLEMMGHAAGGFSAIDSAPAPLGPATLTLAGVRVQVLERWENSRDEDTVLDDSPEPLRAVEIAPIPGPQTAWVGQEDKAGEAPILMGLKVVVLPEGSGWTPPPPPSESAKGEYVFIVGEQRFPLKGVGDEAVPGWKITEFKKFERATIVGDGITEGPAGAPANPAVQVTISDGQGTTERHTAFENFPTMVMGKPLEGPGNSASRLVPGGESGESETLVVFGTLAQTKIGYVALDGKSRVIEPEQKYPMTLDLGDREVTIHKQLARAHQVFRTVQLPPAKENRPALLVRIGDSTELHTLAYKAMAPVPSSEGRPMVLQFGSRRVQLPFSVRLADFKKTDYPGTDMAMAYQSNVGVTLPGQPEITYDIYMNHPFAHGPWKVYQSGFVGEHVSVFSVMHDPGLMLTYIASAVLVIGVAVTFYSRSMSWGHPGIPIRPESMETSHVASRFVRPVSVANPFPEPVASGV